MEHRSKEAIRAGARKGARKRTQERRREGIRTRKNLLESTSLNKPLTPARRARLTREIADLQRKFDDTQRRFGGMG